MNLNALYALLLWQENEVGSILLQTKYLIVYFVYAKHVMTYEKGVTKHLKR